MIRLLTGCGECSHSKTCKYKDNAYKVMTKLKSEIYGDGPNDDYSWEIMMDHYNVDIAVSCPDFSKKGW